MTGEQVKIASDIIKGKIDALEHTEHDQERLRVLDGIPLGTDPAIDAVAELSADRFRAVMRLLVEIKIEGVGKGKHTFDEERIKVRWLS